MSVIVQQPDSLSFAGNLKKFIVTSNAPVPVQLVKGGEQILNETYHPDIDNLVEIDLHSVINKLLSFVLPGTNLITEQTSGVSDFIATIDGAVIEFRVIKCGVADLQELASVFVNDHFLTWQIQDKEILQHQPEWLSAYTNDARNLKAKAYFLDGTNESILVTALDSGKLLTVDVCWASINALLVKKNPIAWEVWIEDIAGTRLSYIQRYCLRNTVDDDRIFLWANTLGGIDSITLTGNAEDDLKLEHMIAEYGDGSLSNYNIDKKREIKQSTGYLTSEESRWIEDFFYSKRRYVVLKDGEFKPIVVSSSKVISTTDDDQDDYEFTYRLSFESQFLNLDRTFDPLPALEVPEDFFLTELLSGLPSAQYSDSLIMAVQSPFATVWQKLSMAQLWGSALPTLIDGSTIAIVDGKLRVTGVTGGVGVSRWDDLLEKPFSSLSNLFSVSPEGALTLANDYSLVHSHPYRPDNWVPSWDDVTNKPDTFTPSLHSHAWADITSKPVWESKMGWDAVNGRVTISTDLHVTGNIFATQEVLTYFTNAVGSDVLANLSALPPLYKPSATQVGLKINDLQFEVNASSELQIKSGILVPALHSHVISDIIGLQVALDGKMAIHTHPYRPDTWVPSWDEVSGKPVTFVPSVHGHAIADVTGLQTALDGKMAIHSHPYRADNWVPNWTEVTDKPLTFLPSSHNHAIADVTGLQTTLDGKMAVHTHPYRPDTWNPNWNDIQNKPIWESKMGWDAVNSRVTISTDLHITGNVFATQEVLTYFTNAVGSDVLANLTALTPLYKASATQVGLKINAVQFEVNASSELQIKSGILAPAAHTHLISDVTGLQTTLDGKMAIHTHPYRPDTWIPSWDDVTGKPSTFTPSAHGHVWGDLSGVPSTFTPSAHTHIISDITGLQTVLDSKMAIHSHPYLSDSDARIAQWSTAFGWGNHTGLYQPLENQRLSTGNSPTFASLASSGEIFLNTNNTYLRGRNTANTAYIAAIGINLSNKVLIDPDNNGAYTGGHLTIAGNTKFTGNTSFANDVWQLSNDNDERFYFSNLGATYIKGTAIIFRDRNNGGLADISSTGIFTCSGGNSNNWNSAYAWGNHSGLYLPISGGTLSGQLNINYAGARMSMSDGTGGLTIGHWDGANVRFEGSGRPMYFVSYGGTISLGRVSGNNLVIDTNNISYAGSATFGTVVATGLLYTGTGSGYGGILLSHANTRFGFIVPSTYVLGNGTTDLTIFSDTGNCIRFFSQGNANESGRFTTTGNFEVYGTITSSDSGAGIYLNEGGAGAGCGFIQFKAQGNQKWNLATGVNNDLLLWNNGGINDYAIKVEHSTGDAIFSSQIKARSYCLKNSSGVTRWTIELGSNDELKFKNAAGVVEFVGDQSGNLKARGEVYTYDTNI